MDDWDQGNTPGRRLRGLTSRSGGRVGRERGAGDEGSRSGPALFTCLCGPPTVTSKKVSAGGDFVITITG
jgi:hypothetical protein